MAHTNGVSVLAPAPEQKPQAAGLPDAEDAASMVPPSISGPETQASPSLPDISHAKTPCPLPQYAKQLDFVTSCLRPACACTTLAVQAFSNHHQSPFKEILTIYGMAAVQAGVGAEGQQISGPVAVTAGGWCSIRRDVETQENEKLAQITSLACTVLKVCIHILPLFLCSL